MTISPLRAIRGKCLDCSVGSKKEVRLCPIKDCPLYGYRLGHNPKRKGIGRTGGNPKIRDIGKGKKLSVTKK